MLYRSDTSGPTSPRPMTRKTIVHFLCEEGKNGETSGNLPTYVRARFGFRSLCFNFVCVPYTGARLSQRLFLSLICAAIKVVLVNSMKKSSAIPNSAAPPLRAPPSADRRAGLHQRGAHEAVAWLPRVARTAREEPLQCHHRRGEPRVLPAGGRQPRRARGPPADRLGRQALRGDGERAVLLNTERLEEGERPGLAHAGVVFSTHYVAQHCCSVPNARIGRSCVEGVDLKRKQLGRLRSVCLRACSCR